MWTPWGRRKPKPDTVDHRDLQRSEVLRDQAVQHTLAAKGRRESVRDLSAQAHELTGASFTAQLEAALKPRRK